MAFPRRFRYDSKPFSAHPFGFEQEAAVLVGKGKIWILDESVE